MFLVSIVSASVLPGVGGPLVGPAGAEPTSPSPAPHDTPLTNTEAIFTPPPPGAPALVPTTEVVSLRTEHAKTFATQEPGKYQSRIYASPIHFKDAAGLWQDIDMTLVPQSDGRLRSRAHSSTVTVSPLANDAQLARVDFDADHSVAYGLHGALPAPVKADGTLGTYASALPHVSLELRGYWAGLKEDLVLASKDAPDTYLFPLKLRGVTAHLVDGEVVYKDADGQDRGRTPRGWMRDSWQPPATEDPNGTRPQTFSEGVAYELVPHAGGTALKMTLDRVWLDDPARVYPVRVDPTTTFNANADDTYVQTNDTTPNHTFSDLNVGTTSAGANKMRSFIHFDTWGVLKGRAKGIGYTRIATHLFDYWGGSGYRPNSMYRVTQGWCGCNMASYPGANVWEEVARRDVHASVHWEQWDNQGILDMVHNWNVPQPPWWEELGIMLKAFDENDNSQYRHYHSANQPGASPHLVTDWWGLPNAPDNLDPGDTVYSTTPWLTARYTHSADEAGALVFDVYTEGGGWLGGRSAGGLCSGCNGSHHPTDLHDGRYQWSAIGRDDSGRWGVSRSETRWFTLDRPPSQPDQLSPATGVVGKTPPTLSARYDHPSGGNNSGQVIFKLYNASDTLLSETYSAWVCRGCTATHTPTGLADGLYKWQAVAYDGGGTGNPNAFSAGTSLRLFRVDTAAPPAPSVSSTSHPEGDTWYAAKRLQAAWPLPSDASGIAGYSVVVDQNPDTVPPQSVNKTDRTYSSPADLPDGQHFLHVSAVDNAGNWSQPAHFGFRVDATTPGAPSITVTNDPDTTKSYPDPAAWLSDNDLRFAWSGGDTASGLAGWSFHRDQLAVSTPDDTSEGALDWQPFPDLADGEHTFHVKRKNNAGTWGATAHRTVRIDATPPTAPTTSSSTHPAPQSNWYANANPTISWSATDTAAPVDGYSWKLDKAAGTVPDTVSEGTGTSRSWTGLADGVWWLHVRARNKAGLWGPTTHRAIRIDAVVETPTITSSSHPSQTAWSTNGDVEFAWSAPAQGQSGAAGWSYSFTGTDPDCSSEGTETTRPYPFMPDGTYVFKLRVIDGLGRCSAVTSYTVNVDTTSPTISSTSSPTHPVATDYYDNAHPELRWTATDTAPIDGFSWVVDRSPNTTPDTVSEGTALVATVPGPLADGESFLHLAAHNTAGLWGPPVHRTIRIDTTPPGSPPVTSATHPASGTWYRNHDPSFEFATSDHSGVDGYSYVLDQSPFTVPDTASEGVATRKDYADLADGVHTFHVRARNRLGMWGEPTHYTVRIDTVRGAPTVTSSTHPNPSAWHPTGAPELRWSGTYPSGVVGWSYTLDQNPSTVPDTASEGTGTTKTYTGLTTGTHYFHVVALTEAGPTEAAHFPIRVDTSPPPAPPVSSDTHPSTTMWYPHATGSASFATTDTAPVDGYSVVVDRIPDTIPATTVNNTSATVDFTVPDDVNYVHVRARNESGLWGPTTHFAVRVDTTVPAAPGVSSSTHPSGTTWYPHDDPEFLLTATDVSGATEFSYVLDASDATEPDTVPEGTDTRLTFADRPDGLQYLHVKVRNGAGLWSTTRHFGVRIDDTAPPAPTMSSVTHSETAWSKWPDASVRFPSEDTAPVAGYSWVLDQSPSTTPDDDSEGADSFATVTPGDGTFYVHAKAQNASGLWGPTSHYVLRTDAVAHAPTLSSTSHPDQPTWYPNRTVALNLRASEESGIAGYAVSVTPGVAGDPGTVVNELGTSTQLELVEDRVWFANVRAKTNSGAWSPPSSYRLKVDADPPATPAASSPSHPDPSRWVTKNDADFVFSTSDVSGIDGYSFVLDQSGNTEPDDTIDTTSGSYHAADLPDGEHSFHVKARNAAGVWSGTRHIRILVDTTPPKLETTWTSPDSADVGETVAFAAEWDSSASPVHALFCRNEDFTATTCASPWAPATAAASEGPAVATYTTTAQDLGQQTYQAVLCDEAELCSSPRAGSFQVVAAGNNTEGEVSAASTGYTRGKRDYLDYFPDKWRPNWEAKRWSFEKDFPPRVRPIVHAGFSEWAKVDPERIGLKFSYDDSDIGPSGWNRDSLTATCNAYRNDRRGHGLTPEVDREFPNIVAWNNMEDLGFVQTCVDETGLDDGLIVGAVMELDSNPDDPTTTNSAESWFYGDGDTLGGNLYPLPGVAQHEAGHFYGFFGTFDTGHFDPDDPEICGNAYDKYNTMCPYTDPGTNWQIDLGVADKKYFKRAYEQGYWLVASDGGVFAFGDAKFYGSMGATRLNSPMVGMAEHPSHNGYYTVAADGGIFSFGAARFYGSMGATRLNKPVVGMAVHPTGNGYWLVAADGGIFSFGASKFHGSTGGQNIRTTIKGMAVTPTGNGYWLVGANGKVFAFGDAVKKGDLIGRHDTTGVIGIAAQPGGGGYWIGESDGDVWNFGDAADWGDALGQFAYTTFVGISTPRSFGRGYTLFGNWLPPEATQPRMAIRRFGNAPYFGRVVGNINQPIVGGADRGYDG